MKMSRERSERKVAVAMLAVAFLGAGALLGSVIRQEKARQHHARESRPAALLDTMRQARPIIAALKRYQATEGRPARTLGDLVPRYLTCVPAPGRAAVPGSGWHYEANGDDGSSEKAGWVLYVEVRRELSPEFLNFGDRFVYHSDGNYPRLGYGGVLERIGRWGYYHE